MSIKMKLWLSLACAKTANTLTHAAELCLRGSDILLESATVHPNMDEPLTDDHALPLSLVYPYGTIFPASERPAELHWRADDE